MLSFKEYRDLQENLQGRTLGLTNPANMGLSGLGRWNEAGLEALKKLAAGDMGDELPVKGKKPCPEEDLEDADVEDVEDVEDEEEEEPAPKKFGVFGKTKDVADGAAMMHKGASKMIKSMKESCGTCKKNQKKFMNAGIPGKPVAELPPEEEDDMEEPEEELDPTMDSDEESDDVESSEDEAPDAAPDAANPMMAKKKPMPMFQKKGMKKGMKKEDAEFMNSMNSHGGMFWKVDEYGNWVTSEDAIIPPSDPNVNLQEPVAGEVGFAPQQKLGTNFTESKKVEKKKVKHVSWF